MTEYLLSNDNVWRVIQNGDLEELIGIWNTAGTSSEGTVIKTFINKNLKTVAERNNLSWLRTDDFRELILWHDRTRVKALLQNLELQELQELIKKDYWRRLLRDSLTGIKFETASDLGHVLYFLVKNDLTGSINPWLIARVYVRETGPDDVLRAAVIKAFAEDVNENNDVDTGAKFIEGVRYTTYKSNFYSYLDPELQQQILNKA